jgi:hypothetical protein
MDLRNLQCAVRGNTFRLSVRYEDVVLPTLIDAIECVAKSSLQEWVRKIPRTVFDTAMAEALSKPAQSGKMPHALVEFNIDGFPGTFVFDVVVW